MLTTREEHPLSHDCVFFPCIEQHRSHICYRETPRGDLVGQAVHAQPQVFVCACVGMCERVRIDMLKLRHHLALCSFLSWFCDLTYTTLLKRLFVMGFDSATSSAPLLPSRQPSVRVLCTSSSVLLANSQFGSHTQPLEVPCQLSLCDNVCSCLASPRMS